MKANTSPAASRISSFLYMIVLVVLALALVALALAVNAFLAGEQIVAVYLVVIGFISLALSTYVLMQSRTRAAALKIETPQILTTMECRKCGFKSVREFQRGDYVFKDLDKCQKCDDKLMITAIYKEVKAKEKTFPF